MGNSEINRKFTVLLSMRTDSALFIVELHPKYVFVYIIYVCVL